MVDITAQPPPSRADLVARLRAAGCVYAEDEAALLVADASSPDRLEELVSRRVAGTPLEHVLGWAAFCGLRIRVDDGVFVPRRRTELVVREAAAVTSPGAVVVDLCCGCGAVGVALQDVAPGVELYAVDIDAAAVRCARRNVAHGTVLQGDLYDALPGSLRGRVDVLVVNAPYVPTDEIGLMPQEARDHEARVALDGGPDGVDVHRRVADGSRAWLRPGGHLLVETSGRQAPATVEAFRRNRLDLRVVSSEEVGGTVVLGRSPGS